MNYVYALYDSANPKVCAYVGLTQFPKARMQKHRNGKQKTREWMSKAAHPVMKILEATRDRRAGLKRERHWIEKLNPELNINILGDGSCCNQFRMSPENINSLKVIQRDFLPVQVDITKLGNAAVAYGLAGLKRQARSNQNKRK